MAWRSKSAPKSSLRWPTPPSGAAAATASICPTTSAKTRSAKLDLLKDAIVILGTFARVVWCRRSWRERRAIRLQRRRTRVCVRGKKAMEAVCVSCAPFARVRSFAATLVTHFFPVFNRGLDGSLTLWQNAVWWGRGRGRGRGRGHCPSAPSRVEEECNEGARKACCLLLDVILAPRTRVGTWEDGISSRKRHSPWMGWALPLPVR